MAQLNLQTNSLTNTQQQHDRNSHSPDTDDTTDQQLDHEAELQLPVPYSVDGFREVLLPNVVLDDADTEQDFTNHLDSLVSFTKDLHLIVFDLLGKPLSNWYNEHAVDDRRNERYADLRWCLS